MFENDHFTLKSAAILAFAILFILTAGICSVLTDRANADPGPRSATHSKVSPPPVPRWMTRPCAEEDSVNCFWNAKQMGNGVGHSFYVRKMPGDVTGLVCYFYTQHRFARNHDHCSPAS